VVGESLAVCGLLSVPQFPGLPQVRVQLTPASLGSFVTFAVTVTVPLTGTEPVGAGSNAIETFEEGGGGGFCTLKVLPPPHPASVAIIAADRRMRVQR
jgi:hypothetical protein